MERKLDIKTIIAIVGSGLCLALIIIAVMTLIRGKQSKNQVAPEDFSFALTWNVYGVSSYDSLTTKLVKTTDATHPEDYVTSYRMTEEERWKVWQLVQDLDIDSYPDEFDPQNGMSSPTMTLILTVRTAEGEKTVAARDIALSFRSEDDKGQQFLGTCRVIQEMLTATEAWQDLPEYEHFYE